MLNNKKKLIVMVSIYMFDSCGKEKNDDKNNFNHRMKMICVNNSSCITLGTMLAVGFAAAFSRGKLNASRFNFWNFLGKNKLY